STKGKNRVIELTDQLEMRPQQPSRAPGWSWIKDLPRRLNPYATPCNLRRPDASSTGCVHPATTPTAARHRGRLIIPVTTARTIIRAAARVHAIPGPPSPL